MFRPILSLFLAGTLSVGPTTAQILGNHNHERYKQELLARYKRGDMFGALALGEMEENDVRFHRTRSKSYQKAVDWYTIAAKGGNETAGMRLVALVTSGKYPLQNREEIKPLIEWAAARGDRDAKLYLGQIIAPKLPPKGVYASAPIPTRGQTIQELCSVEMQDQYPSRSGEPRVSQREFLARRATIPDCVEADRQTKIATDAYAEKIRQDNRSAMMGLAEILVIVGVARALAGDSQACLDYKNHVFGSSAADCP